MGIGKVSRGVIKGWKELKKREGSQYESLFEGNERRKGNSESKEQDKIGYW